MKRHEIDSEIKQKNYEKELLLCKKAGGDVEKYRRLSLDVLQLEQIRIELTFPPISIPRKAGWRWRKSASQWRPDLT